MTLEELRAAIASGQSVGLVGSLSGKRRGWIEGAGADRPKASARRVRDIKPPRSAPAIGHSSRKRFSGRLQEARSPRPAYQGIPYFSLIMIAVWIYSLLAKLLN
jgi:hypothetical protein